jgi:hypothetical protein
MRPNTGPRPKMIPDAVAPLKGAESGPLRMSTEDENFAAVQCPEASAAVLGTNRLTPLTRTEPRPKLPGEAHTALAGPSSLPAKWAAYLGTRS